ncbi:MAG: biopolymer transporter ExbD [Schleiferiaceae bacterium]|jgi:biopolymer transport protein ExbD|nr:biopolymer transporter ExbD [Schleiferiaceae bacterium]
MNLRSRRKVSAEVNMSSMTDLVFLLLIFFILASTLVTSSALDIILPKSGAQTVKKKNITLTVNEDLEFDLNGSIISYDQVESRLIAAASELSADEEPVIVLRADQSIPTGETVRILDIGYRNNMRMIIATDPN